MVKLNLVAKGIEQEKIKEYLENNISEALAEKINNGTQITQENIELLKEVCSAVNVPVIASGGAGCIQDFVTLFKEIPTIDAGLAASIFHFGEVKIADLKKQLKTNGILVR